VGKDLDPFDLLCHVVYGQPPLTRQERAANVRKRNYFTKYAEPAQQVLNTLLDKYADEGVQEIEDSGVETETIRRWAPAGNHQNPLWR
jgi:type I restriction enzyme R subunit